jgi:hypothetical protein
MDFSFSLNSEPVKYALIALTTPLWWPFVRELWKELNASLREEGGIFGSQLSAKELEQLQRVQGRRESPLVSETWAEHEGGAQRGSRERVAQPTARPRARGFR